MFDHIRQPRRLRSSSNLRAMVRQTRLNADDLIQPMFICPGENIRQPVGSMPGVERLSIDRAVVFGRELVDLGVRACILFGIPEHKDALGSEGYHEQGIIQRAVRALKAEVPELFVITDVCLCEYTDHGHCGVIEGGDVSNGPTVELLVREAVSHAEAGVDMVAPSDMMDGRVLAIRAGLDEAGHEGLPIMAYSVKYASAFYGPFRDAADSTPQFGDRRSYQMDPANAREAMIEAHLDFEEGADILMVKPALPYLDILANLRESFDTPLAAYHVSGEYAMVKAAGERGWIDAEAVMEESLLSIRRAGADLIITYAAAEMARRWKERR